jgi:7,8-dihydropterin-6-yl-methyl-4-(beta-D-ribofuranosyl)aminobenzene 5'-phosphate synthase
MAPWAVVGEETMPLLTEVDRLEVQVLVDNVTDSLSSTPPFVTREWPALVRQGMRRVAGASLCCANHGLSLVLRATAGAACSRRSN